MRQASSAKRGDARATQAHERRLLGIQGDGVEGMRSEKRARSTYSGRALIGGRAGRGFSALYDVTIASRAQVARRLQQQSRSRPARYPRLFSSTQRCAIRATAAVPAR